jgi:hypothetical protein
MRLVMQPCSEARAPLAIGVPVAFLSGLATAAALVLY